MNFDREASKERVGVGVWVISQNNESTLNSFKLGFDCTNNVAKYEALMLGLNILKEKKAKKITIHRDFELIINQVNGLYQTKHLKMRAYINAVLDMIENFTEYNIYVIPRSQNNIVDSLAIVASNFKLPVYPSIKYDIEVRHVPIIPDNVENW